MTYDDRLLSAPLLRCALCRLLFYVQSKQPISDPYVCLGCR